MKKYNLLKVLAITVFVAWLLTLIIPGSYVDYLGNVTKGTVSGVGVWALLSNLNISISYFNGIVIFIVAIACFYAVLNKVSVYNKFVDKVSDVFKNKQRALVIASIIVFGALGMIVSDAIILIVFMPFVYSVMKRLDIDKKVILSSTIIATIIGSMCGIYNNTLFGLLNLEVNTLLLVKVILLVFSLLVLIILTAPKSIKKKDEKVVKTTKKTTSKNAKTVKAEEKKTSVKKVAPKSKEAKVNKVLYAVLTLALGSFGINKFYARNYKSGLVRLLFCWTLVPTVLSIAEFITVLTEKADKNGCVFAESDRRNNVLFGTSVVLFTIFVIFTIIPWESLLTNFTAFSDFNTWLSNIKIGDYAVFSNIVGAPIIVDMTMGSQSGVIPVLGNWSMVDVGILLLILTAVIAATNKIKFNEFIATSTEGIKKVLPVAITAMLISIVLIIMVNTGVNVTITNWILSITKGFNIATSTVAAMVSSVLTGDFYYFVSSVGSVYTAVITNSDYYGVIGLILQSVYNLMMIIAPTSVALIIGLYYLDIPYTKWLKYIWKVFVCLLVIIIITAIIIYFMV